MYPTAKVIGTDLSPIQPTWVPPNVEFRIDDIDKPWMYGDDTFDLVHDRLGSGVAIKNWPAYLAEAYRTTKPGGWVGRAPIGYGLYGLSTDMDYPRIWIG
jgi:hypothetical protein